MWVGLIPNKGIQSAYRLDSLLFIEWWKNNFLKILHSFLYLLRNAFKILFKSTVNYHKWRNTVSNFHFELGTNSESEKTLKFFFKFWFHPLRFFCGEVWLESSYDDALSSVKDFFDQRNLSLSSLAHSLHFSLSLPFSLSIPTFYPPSHRSFFLYYSSFLSIHSYLLSPSHRSFFLYFSSFLSVHPNLLSLLSLFLLSIFLFLSLGPFLPSISPLTVPSFYITLPFSRSIPTFYPPSHRSFFLDFSSFLSLHSYLLYLLSPFLLSIFLFLSLCPFLPSIPPLTVPSF